MFTGRSTSSVSRPPEDDVCFLVYNKTTECKMTLNMRSVKFKLDSIFLNEAVRSTFDNKLCVLMLILPLFLQNNQVFQWSEHSQ